MKSHLLAGLTLSCALVFVAAAPRAFADDRDRKTDVTISEAVEVPGGVILQPGTYMFRLMEATANRHVVEIKSDDGQKTYAIVMTAAAYRVRPTDKVVLTFWEMPSGQPAALRKWFWPGDVDGQEFLYPHKRAAEIAKLSNETVPEAPEDQAAANAAPAAAPAAASAAVNDASVSNNAPAPAVNTAAVTPAPAPSSAPESVNVTETTTSVTPAAPAADQSQLLAQATPPPASTNNAAPSTSSSSQSSNDTSSLPQTGSDIPLLALIGGLSLTAAIAVRQLSRA